MASDSTPKGYILKITLLMTTNPEVHRLLSVPSDLHFAELHTLIAAAFGWNADGKDPCTSWIFRATAGPPAEHVERRHDRNVVVYTIDHPGGAGTTPIEPPQLNADRSIVEFLTTCRWWTYEDYLSRHRHGIEILKYIKDSSPDIGYRGGQGSINRVAWQLRELKYVSGVKAVKGSSWELEMEGMLAAIKAVDNAYKERLREDDISSEEIGIVPSSPSEPEVRSVAKKVQKDTKGIVKVENDN